MGDPLHPGAAGVPAARAVPTAIAVGYDGSPDSAAALGWAAELAARTGAELRIVHAVGLLEHAGLSRRPAVRESALALAAGAGVEEGRAVWCPLDGEPASVLVRQAEHGADLLVVGTRGLSAHAGVLGSTSLELAERSPVPVVIVPRRGAER